MSNPNRRDFLGTTLAAGMGGVALWQTSECLAADPPAERLGAGKVLVLQGDSITDAGRDRKSTAFNNQPAMGRGYASMIAASLLVDHGYNLKIFNRGISGNKVHELAERWQADCLDLKPDLLSILIGVNDIWHRLNGRYDGTVETYENDYRKLLQQTKAALPEITLVICEPFVLKCGAVNDDWFPEFDGFRAAAKRIAEEFAAIWVPFQSAFDRALEFAPPEYWAADGVHPTAHGAALMSHFWRETVARA